MVNEPTNNVQVTNEQVIEEAHEIAPRRTEIQRRPAISSDLLYIHLNINVN